MIMKDGIYSIIFISNEDSLYLLAMKTPVGKVY